MSTPDSVWLVGLSGAGKSTVGPIVANALGFDFVDLDDAVEETVGATVSEIFRRGGESAFRAAEARASDRLLERRRLVVATGGGWMARDDISRGPPGCVRVWLRVSPVAAFARLDGERGCRPLLSEGDGEGRLAALLAARGDAYGEAEIVVDTTDLDPAEVAGLVVKRLSGIRK